MVLFLLTVVAARAAWSMYDTFKISVEARESAEGQLATLTSDSARLSAEVAAFDTEAGMEREMRERFGVALPGEGEIRIVRDEASSSPNATAQQNLFMRVLHSLFVW